MTCFYNPQISIIIPVYNVEKYLHRCVDSILLQTFTDFELLLVDDGSKDDSGVICDEYVTKDSRIRVFHKENGGASSARNWGLDKARGEWIVFIDSDDCVEEDYLKLLYDERSNVFPVSSYVYVEGEDKSYEQLTDGVVDLNFKSLTDILMKGAFMTPISKLFNRDILDRNRIRFNCKLTSREDTLFVWTYFLYVDKIKTISSLTYNYYITKSGLSHKRISIKETVYALDCFYKLLLELQNKYEGFDINDRHIWLVEEIFKKTVIEEVCENKNFIQRKNKLYEMLSSHSVNCLLKDKIIVPKGIKRRIFDFLGMNKCYLLLTLYLYFYKYN